MVELGPHQPGNLALVSYNDHISLTDSDENQTFDFPVALQVSRNSPVSGLYLPCVFMLCVSADISGVVLLRRVDAVFVDLCRDEKHHISQCPKSISNVYQSWRPDLLRP